jgi:hypothetical protein
MSFILKNIAGFLEEDGKVGWLDESLVEISEEERLIWRIHYLFSYTMKLLVHEMSARGAIEGVGEIFKFLFF